MKRVVKVAVIILRYRLGLLGWKRQRRTQNQNPQQAKLKDK
ncbi:MAG: hypothetical protein AAF364_09350 [Pseudomonadota bacterium]